MQSSPDEDLSLDACRRLLAAGRFAEGLSAAERLMAAEPGNAEAAQLKGAALYLLKRPAEAVAAFHHAISLDPTSAPAYQNMVMALIDIGAMEDAATVARRAVELAPGSVGARRNLAFALGRLGRYEEALAAAEAATMLAPADAVPVMQAGHALARLGRPEDAERRFRRALELDPRHVDANFNLGVVLQETRRDEAAIAAYGAALAVDPGHRGARLNLGAVLRGLGRIDEARAVWTGGPGAPEASAELHYNIGCLSLLAGDWLAGWPGFERRFEVLTMPAAATVSGAPFWNGEAAPGRTLLVTHEQGFGDVLQFARLLTEAARRVGRLVFLVPAPLRAILSGMKLFRPRADGRRPQADLVVDGEPLPAHDARVSLLSLPRLFGLTPATMLPGVPYLFADPAASRDWAERLPPRRRGGMRVGLVWQGNPATGADRGRSLPLAAFAPLGRLGDAVAFVSLQKGAGSEQESPPGLALHRLGSGFDEGPDAFLDSAAVIAELDLVVTTDTAVAHLAGAMGRPVWLLLRHVPDWRWGLDGLLTPWYPTMRLFRQPAPGDWDAVIEAVTAELAALAALLAAPPLGPSENGEALFAAATRLTAAKRLTEACDIYRRLHAAFPLNGRLLNYYAMARLEAGGRGRDVAREVLPAALRSAALSPGEADLWSNLAVALDHADHRADGKRALEFALGLSPRHAPSLIAMANREIAAGETASAVKRTDAVLADVPENAHALSVKASALLAMQEPAKAEQALRRAVQLEPTNARYLLQWGVALNAVKDHKGATRAWERAVCADPANADAFSNLGVEERNRGLLGLSLLFQRTAAALDPHHAEARCNLGIAALEAGRDEEALVAFREAIALKPDYADAHMSLGMALLNTGDLAEGLKHYERRLDIDKLGLADNRPKLTPWRGEDLAGRSILILAEQGFGDAFQFVRYAAVLKARGAGRVVVGCRRLIAGLMARVRGVDAVVVEGASLPSVDFYAYMLSLPLLCGTRLETIPAEDRYITADPDRVTRWAGRLADKLGFRVGIVWQGNPDPHVDAGRSFPLAALEPLARVPGVRLIALQKGKGEEQIAALAGRFEVETLGADFDAGPDAFADTAAVIANLDLVVSSDTAVAHLAGALGRPTWVVLRAYPEWRWLRNRDDSPWYPMTRLFRRLPDEDEPVPFTGACERLAAALARLVAGDRKQLFGRSEVPAGEARRPDVQTLYRKARLAHGKGDAAVARKAYADILIDNPDWVEAIHMLGALALTEYSYPRGLLLLRLAEARGLATADFRTNFAVALRHTGNEAQAERIMRELIAERPTPEAEMTLGHIIRDDGRFAESIEHYSRAIAMRPDMAKAYRGLGNALKDLNRVDEALASFAKARTFSPNDPELLLDEAHAYLLGGDYRRGFAAYEVRWKAMEMLPRHFSVPRWKGEDYAGKTLLVHGEQGIGDQVQFSRFLAPAAARGGRLVVEIRPTLIELMRRVDWGGTEIEFVEQGRRLPPHDLEVPMMSLPVVFETEVDTLPPPLPFAIDRARIDAWRASLGGAGKLRVGLIWQGNPNARADIGRSPPLEALTPLFEVPGLHFVSLQMRDGLDQIRAFRYGDRIEILGERLAGFAETAAAMNALDIVVSSCTSSAHLAGSLGRPTFVMLKSNADWRWLVGREDSPWYPSVRLFRQPSYGDWDTVAARIAAALAVIAGAS